MSQVEPKNRPFHRVSWRLWLEDYAKPFFFFLGALVIVVNTIFLVQIQRKSECQTDYNNKIAETIGIRARLTAASDDNQNKLILGVAQLMAQAQPEGTQTPAQEDREDRQFRQLFADFTAESQRIAKERAESPIPELPDCART